MDSYGGLDDPNIFPPDVSVDSVDDEYIEWAPPVSEPLRDRAGRALYERESAKSVSPPDWYTLSEERREPWRLDADVVLAIASVEVSRLLNGTPFGDLPKHIKE